MRILYISHIPWGFIKQRPQFIAEELSRYCTVDVVYRKSNRPGNSNFNIESRNGNLNVKGFRMLPSERFHHAFNALCEIFNKRTLLSKIENLDVYDIIWVSHPELYHLISDRVNQNRVVYDCMDDLSAFPEILKFPKYRERLMSYERDMHQRLPLIIYSADNLRNTLQIRYGGTNKSVVVNNAISSNIKQYAYDTKYDIGPNTITYIGAISEWLDYDVILASLEKFSYLHYAFFGPYNDRIAHPRITYYGTVPHSEILGIMDNSMALVLPFKINDLIRSVNPVKLYEYIYSGKPVIATRYGESEKFKDYVQLYRGVDEYCHIVDNILHGQITIDKQSSMDFALANTWENRASEIINLLKRL